MSELVPVLVAISKDRKTLRFGKAPKTATGAYKSNISNYPKMIKELEEMFLENPPEANYIIKMPKGERDIEATQNEVKAYIKDKIFDLSQQTETAKTFESMMAIDADGDENERRMEDYRRQEGEVIGATEPPHEGGAGEEKETETAEAGTQAEAETAEAGAQAGARTREAGAQARPLRRTLPTQATPETTEAGTQAGARTREASAGPAVPGDIEERVREAEARQRARARPETREASVGPAVPGDIEERVREAEARQRASARPETREASTGPAVPGDIEERIREAEERQRQADIVPPEAQARARQLMRERGMPEGGGGAEEEKGIEDEAGTGPAGPPPPPSSGPPSGAGAIVSEDDAKKALKQNPQADVNPALIGPDSAEEMKGLIYKDAFSLIFSDRSGVREMEQFKNSEENKTGERKAPDILFEEAEEIREGYKDQLRVIKLVFSVADEKKYLLQQWQEMHVLKKGAVQNITAGKSVNPLNNYDSIGLVVDISSLGVSLDDFLNYAERAGLSATDGLSGGTTKLSGFRKPVDLSDVAPKNKNQDVKPMSEEQAEKDKKDKSEVIGAPEYITNRPIRGVLVKDGLKVKKKKEKRIKLYL